MRLYHTTPSKNVEAIRREGLLLAKCRTSTLAVWLHTVTHRGWAIMHTARRHEVAHTDVSVLCVDVPVAWCVWHATGFWRCGRDIPPGRIKFDVPSDDAAGSEENNA